VGLLPAAVSSGIGSQVQKPLALVVVGGILLAPILILLVLPVLIQLFSARTAWADQEEEEEPIAVDGKRRSAELGDV
jgi:cobalt-zinc-cadmium resistance protein CzcA